jgi:4-deoxy-L-threo-5-hexosulose-uronate ketol-isomerase
MDVRFPSNPEHVKNYTTAQLRDEFLIKDLFQNDELVLVYSHIDRIITGGACPVSKSLQLTASKQDLGSEFFLERRELGIVNVGGAGKVNVDGTDHAMARLDGLYVGMGTKKVEFSSDDKDVPAHFYFSSTPAHMTLPTTHIPISNAEPLRLGDIESSNKRTIYKYIHPDGPQSCQLVMGVTLLEPNNMWNTMPTHMHARRMEVYFYFDIDGDNVVFHLHSEPDETRHLIIRNEQAVISPSWSIHSGMGTGNYAFIWAMAGENQTFSDMDAVPMSELM